MVYKFIQPIKMVIWGVVYDMVLPTLLVFQLTFLGPHLPHLFRALIFAPRLKPLWPRSHGNHRYLTAWARVEEVGKSWKIPFDPSKLLAMLFYNIYISQYTLDFETRLHDFGTSTHEFETFTTLYGCLEGPSRQEPQVHRTTL